MEAGKEIEWEPLGKRLVGRPRKRWLDEVGVARDRRGLRTGDVEETGIYENRDILEKNHQVFAG